MNEYKHIAATLNAIAYYPKEYRYPVSSFRRQDKKFSWLIFRYIPIETYYSIETSDKKTLKFLTEEEFIKYITADGVFQVIDGDIYFAPKVVLRFPHKLQTEQRFKTDEEAEKYFYSIISQYNTIDNIKTDGVEITVIK